MQTLGEDPFGQLQRVEGPHVKGDVWKAEESSGLELREGAEVGERQEQFVWVILYLKKVTKGKYSFSALMVHCTKQNSKFRIKISFVQI